MPNKLLACSKFSSNTCGCPTNRAVAACSRCRERTNGPPSTGPLEAGVAEASSGAAEVVTDAPILTKREISASVACRASSASLRLLSHRISCGPPISSPSSRRLKRVTCLPPGQSIHFIAYMDVSTSKPVTLHGVHRTWPSGLMNFDWARIPTASVPGGTSGLNKSSGSTLHGGNRGLIAGLCLSSEAADEAAAARIRLRALGECSGGEEQLLALSRGSGILGVRMATTGFKKLCGLQLTSLPPPDILVSSGRSTSDDARGGSGSVRMAWPVSSLFRRSLPGVASSSSWLIVGMRLRRRSMPSSKRLGMLIGTVPTKRL